MTDPVATAAPVIYRLFIERSRDPKADNERSDRSILRPTWFDAGVLRASASRMLAKSILSGF